jgi:hypothetical protein
VVERSPKGQPRPLVSLSPTSLHVLLVGCGSAWQVGTWVQTQNTDKQYQLFGGSVQNNRISDLERARSLGLAWALWLFWPLRQPHHNQSTSYWPRSDDVQLS